MGIHNKRGKIKVWWKWSSWSLSESKETNELHVIETSFSLLHEHLAVYIGCSIVYTEQIALACYHVYQADVSAGWSHLTRWLKINNRRTVTSLNPESCQIPSWLPTNTELSIKSCYSATDGEKTLTQVAGAVHKCYSALSTWEFCTELFML